MNLHIVTHVIAKADENMCVVKRTHKYIAACIYGRWVLDVDWLRACEAQKAIVPEADFELYGDTVSGQSLGTRRNRERVESEALSPLAAHTFYFCPTTGAMGHFLAHHLPWLQITTHQLTYTRSPTSPTAGPIPSSDLLLSDTTFALPSSYDPSTHELTGLPTLSRASRATKSGYALRPLDRVGTRTPQVAVRVDPRRPILVVRGATGAAGDKGEEPTWTLEDTRRIEALQGWQVVPLGVVLRSVTECKAVGEVGMDVGGVDERVVRCALGEEVGTD
ncbi:hypothetical protein BCR44DRAFT_1438213 [Catenaria anguillulae PL171]|uniref:BRCT domain-containing protein n=1 Tax=Catenaria anguillulae PL171 TaxID=765915 RepID=A0A1Y2HG37_9FUNG|nr:hypothetical protein BCR44DRAFT_1438213 [Catenaria anguillulae PL171]